MKAHSIKYFDLASTGNGRTIDLAGILGVPQMEPIEAPIKIKIHGKKSEIHQIPVRIVESIDHILSFEQLEDVVIHKIATKPEFRSWKEIQKYFSL